MNRAASEKAPLMAGAILLAAASLSGCGMEPIQFEETSSHIRGANPDRALCEQPTIPTPDPQYSHMRPAVPYPTPAGEEVTPGIIGIPLPPSSEQIDSFRNGETIVQVFATDVSPNEVFDFYDDVMREHGWFVASITRGLSCEYVSELVEFKSTPEYRIEVTTSFVPRAGEETANGTPPPGFRGEGFGFEPRSATKTIFSIVTPHN